ncbi:hypothetical protein O3S80_50980 [Streptomyces sp. Lzd4kr]|nr:hypothetical protein [Streptomyces sp. Lzd4kr]
MSQPIDFHLSSVAGTNQHAGAAEEHTVAWLRKHRMLREAQAVERYLSWRVAGLAGACWPRSDRAGLYLASDLLGFFLLFDDQFDGPRGKDPAHVAQICQRLILIIRGKEPNPRSPVQNAFADVWQRSVAGMSNSWIFRTASNFESYFAMHPHEAMGRSGAANIDFDTYLQVRRGTLGMQICFDMTERIYGYELPGTAYFSPQVRRMWLLATDVVAFINDVFSHPKEQERGDAFNFVSVLQQSQGISQAEAIAEAQRLVRYKVQRFHEIKDRLPAMCRSLGQSADERACVLDYATALSDWIVGCHVWHRESRRYQLVIPASIPGYLEELIPD